ncbi:MAG: type II secretion system F family protein [Bdellovibrionota bacterium]|nr:type II secretion system F family protein [Bdellovibrionota bacterium]
MPNFRWEGLNKERERDKGMIEADNMRDAKRLLKGQGIKVRKISPPSLMDLDINQAMVDAGFMKPFGAKELMNFTKQLSTMIGAGVPIMMALEIIQKSEKNPVLKNTIAKIAREVAEGKTLADSLAAQQGFDKLYCNLVRAGEVSGILDGILKKLSEHLEKAEQTKAQVKGAMTYPAIVVTVGVGVVWALMTYVVPQFVSMFKDSGKELPSITLFVIDVSNYCQENSLKMVATAFALGIAFKSWKQTPLGSKVMDIVGMRAPAFGKIIIKGNLTTFSRTLATLLAAGVSLIDALDICIEVLDNQIIAADIKEVRDQVVQGKTLTEPLAKIEYFPDMVTQMIKVGEQTGSIDQMLVKISEVFEEEVNEAVKAATSLIEPIILVGLGGCVAVILVAVYLPMFTGA